jgi:hypothetical protein
MIMHWWRWRIRRRNKRKRISKAESKELYFRLMNDPYAYEKWAYTDSIDDINYLIQTNWELY